MMPGVMPWEYWVMQISTDGAVNSELGDKSVALKHTIMHIINTYKEASQFENTPYLHCYVKVFTTKTKNKQNFLYHLIVVVIV